MRAFLYTFIGCLFIVSCKSEDKFKPRTFNGVEFVTLLEDSLLSVRAIDILNDGSLSFAANNGAYGLYSPKTKMFQTNIQRHDSLNLHFRAVAHTATDFFMLSIENPALLYKTGDSGKMTLVYEEQGQGVFYDAMTFWNNREGIAVGDYVNGCLSIIITRDGGATWMKISCSELPGAEAGEGAFAASNTNIKVLGNKAWIGTTHGNIYYSEDKGKSWKLIKTPIVKAGDTEGIYSIDFYNEHIGFAIGGDYMNPEIDSANKMLTVDGGKTWELVAANKNPGYRSCVQYIPKGEGKELVAVGFKGIDYSNDGGLTWKHLSDESYYTIRFINNKEAYVAGSGRISKVTFRE
ncbi:WD40/YVTN/BNR-like repeat-containing protein [Gaetbulibacter saemankumensis]|uniref:WD40/YVTN/BNR-like repeat-containing protein n=1 Tax=Gaetbulibacter saemankumensis TaxID=311208 RepID=UPI00042687E2|nr:oxidoreductase [Gaetbulibacter saemankumensis]